MKPRDSESLPEPAFGVLPRLPWLLQEALVDWRREMPTWQPTKDLAHLHVPVIVTSLWQRLIAAVREPARVGIVGGRRVIQVLGIARLTCEADGEFSVQLHDSVEGVMKWVEMPPHEIVLMALPTRWIWLGLIRRSAAVELARHLRFDGNSPDAAELDRYTVALFKHFRRALGRHPDLRVMRQKVSVALALNPDALRIAHRLMNLLPDGGESRLSYYNTVIRQLEAFKALEREAPQMIALYGALIHRPDIDPSIPPAQALRAQLVTSGLSPSTWRLLLKAGPRLFMPVRDFYKGEARTAMLDYLLILEVLGLESEPPPSLMWEVLSRFANPGWRFERHVGQIRPLADSFGHAAREYAALATPLATPLASRHELALVLEWLARARPKLDKPQRRAGWPWLINEANAWTCLQRVKLLSEEEQWSTPVNETLTGAYLLRPIETALALWDEGRAMHHCAYDHLSDCSRGSRVLISVRLAREPARRVATAMFARQQGRWRCIEVRGPQNHDVDPRVNVVLNDLALFMNARSAERLALKPQPTFGPDWGCEVGDSPAGIQPLQMPRSARFVAHLGWHWSPVHCCIGQYHLSMNRQRSVWLLWWQYFDDNWSEWGKPRVVAHVRRQGLSARQATLGLLRALWLKDSRCHDRGRFSEFVEEGLVAESDLTAIAKAIWPE